jgi:hypothetical protein
MEGSGARSIPGDAAVGGRHGLLERRHHLPHLRRVHAHAAKLFRVEARLAEGVLIAAEHAAQHLLEVVVRGVVAHQESPFAAVFSLRCG